MLSGAFQIVPDSGGPGTFRGGLGIRRDIRTLQDTVLTTRSEGHSIHPWGIHGGMAGAPSRVIQHPDTAHETTLPAKKSNIPLKPGDVVSIRTPGGGGFGPPEARDRELVRWDVINDLISPESAARDYGYQNGTQPMRKGDPIR